MSRRFRKLLFIALIALLGAAPAVALSSCGTTRSYWGVENEYLWGDGPGHHHHHKPPKKHKKYKKHKKPKKHHHHHHHHDDDDDD